MKFSVLISIYYKENPRYFEDAINSILNQTRKANEIVIIKDGPLSKPLEDMVDRYQKDYPDLIQVYSLSKNQGLGQALSYGILKCKYEVIARMDADDIAIKTRFEKQISFLEEHPEFSMIGSNILEYDEIMEKALSYKTVPHTNEEIIKYSKKRNPFNHMSMVYKKSAVLAVGDYQTCYGFEDYYLWCRMLQKGYLGYNIQEVLIKARTGKEMMLRRGGKRYIRNVVQFENSIFKLKYINIFQYIFNIIVRVTISIVPKQLRYFIYYRYLREVRDDLC